MQKVIQKLKLLILSHTFRSSTSTNYCMEKMGGGDFQDFFQKTPSKLKKFSHQGVDLSPNPPGYAPAE